MEFDSFEDRVSRRISALDVHERPRLRFDKVAIRFLSGVRSGLSDAVPSGKTLVLTIAAPIRMASKTISELEEKLRVHLARAPRAEFNEPIQGNDIRARMLDSPKGAPRVVAFVHSSQPGAAQLLFDVTQSLLELED